ncbi:Mediator complex subunit 15 [Carabus blaptoides fortunei]
MAAEDNSWRTQAFRQSVVSKIDEAIQRSGMSTSRNSVDMENHVFQKAKTREEYLGLVARLILHVREINTKKGMQGPNAGQAGPGMQDPINALQTLASQGTRTNQMMGMGGPQAGPMGGPQAMPPIAASNLLQNLNQRPGQGLQGLQGLQGQMGSQQLAQMQAGQQMAQIPGQLQNQIQMQGQVTPGQLGQLQTQMQNQMQGQMPSQMQPGMGGPPQMNPQLSNQMQTQVMGQLGGQMSHLQQRKPGDGMMMNNPNAGFPGPRNPTPNQFLTQSPTQGVQSPAGMGGPPSGNQMVASPALVPSPSPQMGMMGGPQRSVGMAPSPSGSLNTPGQAVPTPSPMGMQEEQAYREKVRQLSKYIEPLRKMIARMGNDDVEKLSKMKKLLEILSNPSQRMPLETLIKCEVVLEKLDFKRGEGSVASMPSHLTLKEHHIFNPLLEAINNHIQSTVINHTMHRTFGPALEALFGPEIKLPPPLKRKNIDSEPSSDIPDVLQGEIARLDQRFKLTMSPLKQPGSRSVQLMCHLDDKHLPCVPPVSLTIPEDYPKNSPVCYMSPHDYDATNFLRDVKKALLSRIENLPQHFSVSQLLATWEMSIRQACAPVHIPVSATTVLMGL